MKLYLVQHGQAESKEVDPAQPLSDRGRQATLLIAELAAKLGLDVQEIRHSGKLRAEQTAAIFGRALSLMGNVAAVSGLNPTDDVQPIADALTREEPNIMLVGHLPFLSRLAGLLINGDPENSPVDFRNSGVVCLERTADGWQVRWRLTPG